MTIELPDNWIELQVQEFASVKGGKRLPQGAKYSDFKTKYPYIRVSDFTDGGVDLHDIRYIDELVQKEISRYTISCHDLYISIAGTIGLVGQIPQELDGANLTENAAKIALNDKDFMLSQYLCRYLSSEPGQAQIQDLTVSTSQPKLALFRIESIKVPIPPLNEQKRIVAKLDAIFARTRAAKERLAKIPALLEKLKQSVLAAAFRGDLTKEWRENNPPTIPTNRVKLEQVADDFSYGSSAKSSPEGKIPVLRMGNIQNGKLDWSDLVFTSDVHEIEKYKLEPGDVLFNRTNSPELVGKTAVYLGERPSIYAGYLIRIKCNKNLMPQYLGYCLNSKEGKDYCWRVKSDGVSQSNINAKKLAAFEFNLPSIDEQKEIIRIVEAFLEYLTLIEARYLSAVSRLDKVTSVVLSKAFRGELVEQDPNDEPASVLLERIRQERAQQANSPKKGRRTKEASNTNTLSKETLASQKEHSETSPQIKQSPAHLKPEHSPQATPQTQEGSAPLLTAEQNAASPAIKAGSDARQSKAPHFPKEPLPTSAPVAVASVTTQAPNVGPPLILTPTESTPKKRGRPKK